MDEWDAHTHTHKTERLNGWRNCCCVAPTIEIITEMSIIIISNLFLRRLILSSSNSGRYLARLHFARDDNSLLSWACESTQKQPVCVSLTHSLFVSSRLFDGQSLTWSRCKFRCSEFAAIDQFCNLHISNERDDITNTQTREWAHQTWMGINLQLSTHCCSLKLTARTTNTVRPETSVKQNIIAFLLSLFHCHYCI